MSMHAGSTETILCTFARQLYPERLPTGIPVWKLDFPNSNGIPTLLSALPYLY